MKSRKLISIGLVLLVVSVAIGLVGPAWGIYKSFDALEMNESAGIGSVGGALMEALIFSIVGIVGLLVATVLIVVGLIRSRRS